MSVDGAIGTTQKPVDKIKVEISRLQREYDHIQTKLNEVSAQIRGLKQAIDIIEDSATAVYRGGKDGGGIEN